MPLNRKVYENKILISYILPVFQAESFIYNNLKLFSEYCAESDLTSEIIVINDGSTDRTNEVINDYLRDNKDNTVKYLNLQKNSGKGSVIKKGVEIARGQYMVFTDCDLPYSFKNISNVVDHLINNGSNIVIGCRMHRESIYKIKSENLSYIYIRHTSGRIYNKLINFFTHLNIDDTQAGLKGFDRETAELVFKKMTVSGFSFDIDILACAQENRKIITAIPIEFNYDSEMSTINFLRQTFFMTIGLLRVFFKVVTGYYRR